MSEEEIQAEIAATAGWDLERKFGHYHILAIAWKRRTTLGDEFLRFSKAAWDVQSEFCKWDKTPPIWYHGGPAGMKAGDDLLAWPRVPCNRKSRTENVMAGLGLVRKRDHWVYFTPDRLLALEYSKKHKDGRVYRIKPEGDIQVDPEAFFFMRILQHDKTVSTDFQQIAVTVLGVLNAWRTPSATVLGAG